MALWNLTVEWEWRQPGPSLLSTGRNIRETEHRGKRYLQRPYSNSPPKRIVALRNLTAEWEWRQPGPSLLRTGRHIRDTEHRKIIFPEAIF